MQRTTMPPALRTVTLDGWTLYHAGPAHLLFKAWDPAAERGRFLRLHPDGSATFHASKRRDAPVLATLADAITTIGPVR